jgi:MFS family permease
MRLRPPADNLVHDVHVSADRLPAAASGLIALAVAIAVADGSIVTLALPSLFAELGVTVEGLAAVIGVYTLVLAVALLPAEWLRRRLGSAPIGIAGMLIFAAASALCAAADSLTVLLVGRGIQAIGAAALLVAAFSLLDAGRQGAGARLWGLAAVLGFAAGPAIGGALTEAFDWRAIFGVQVPIGLAAAVGCAWALRSHAPGDPPAAAPTQSRPPLRAGDLIALALLAAALTAVLFGLVLLLVAGWAYSPLAAAAAVSVLPLAALAASFVPGEPRTRAAAGCALVAAGIASLAFLPDAEIAWTIAPTALAGAGMGLALPALSGALLPESRPHDAARNLAVRHLGITVALIALAPVLASALDSSIESIREEGVAVILDAQLSPQTKIELAPRLLSSVNAERPRAALRDEFTSARADFEGDELVELDVLAGRTDDALVSGVGDAFQLAFLITAALALVAILFVKPAPRAYPAVAGVIAVAAVLPAGYAIAQAEIGVEPIVIADPCQDRELPDVGGITGFAQDVALQALDRAACRFGSSREELVLALADDEARQAYEEELGVDPLSPLGIIEGLIGGG